MIASPPEKSLLRLESWTFAVVLGMAALRALVAATAPLSADEAYYWQWTRPLQLSYFDHPAMVAAWIWAGVQLFGTSAWGVRVAAVVSSLVVSALVWDTARIAFRSRRAGAWAALFINASILFESAGVIVTPDSPLILFWSLALWAVIRLFADARTRWLYVVGLALGLGAISKYTMALLLPGLLATFLLFRQAWPWWRRFQSLGAVLLAFGCTLPVLAWNAQHQWASFHKQLSHAFDDTVAKGNLPQFLGAQVGLLTPFVFLFCLWGMGWALHQGWRKSRADWFLLGAVSAPPLAFFAFRAASGMVQAHWAGPAYIAATIAAAGAFTACERPRWLRLGAVLTPCLGLVLVGLVFLQATTAALPLPIKADPLKRLGGWDELASAVAAERDRHPGAFLFTEKHEPTGPVSFYLPDHSPVFLQGPIRPSYYAAADVAALKGRDGIFITRTRTQSAWTQQPWFDRLIFLRHVDLHWGGRIADSYDLYLCTDYKGGAFVMGDGFRGTLDR